MIKNEKGVTIIALVVTVIIILIILGSIIYSTSASLEIKELNNMYSDIKILEDKVAMYYLDYGKLPVKKGAIQEIPEGICKYEKNEEGVIVETPIINPNDTDNQNHAIYYEIDISLLDNITLYNSGDIEGENEYVESTDTLKVNNKEIYIINKESHTIYFLQGVTIDDITYYTRLNDKSEYRRIILNENTVL